MSPRAAWRLESLGFREVYEYPGGKLDWIAAGLPSQGLLADQSRAGDVARKDVPTCGLAERLGEVADRVRAAGWEACIVVNERGVVLGRLGQDELGADVDRTIEEVMRPGPSTFRPHVPIGEMAEYMQRHDMQGATVTRSDGRLVGLLRLEDAVEAVAIAHRHGDYRHQEGR